MNSGVSLLLLIVLPLAGGLVGAVLKGTGAARSWAIFVSLCTLGAAIWLAGQFNYRQDLNQFQPWERSARSVQVEFPASGSIARAEANDSTVFGVSSIRFYFHLGADTISLWLVLLTALLMPLAIGSSWLAIKDRAKEYYAWMLLLEMAMLGCFIARDVLLFYIFFELTLIPMFFIIGIWGGPDRRHAAGKFFLMTFSGSVFTLAAVIYLGLQAGDFDIIKVTQYAQNSLSSTERWWILLAFLAGFSIKVPLFPVHTWLPLAHTEAPTAGSVILAGVLLKLGTYGLLRFAMPMGAIDPLAYQNIAFPALIQALAALCIIGIIYAALVAWVQQDIKKIVAYSSVAHLGFCVLGLVALNTIGIQGSIMYMVNHGVSTGALFLVVGMIYERFHTRDINQLSGLAARMPKFAFFFVLFALSSIGLPGTNGFVSEFLTVLGAFTSEHLGPTFGAFAATGVVLGSIYILYLVARVIWGPLKFPGSEGAGHGHAVPDASHEPSELPPDISGREIAILTPLAVLVIVIGILPTHMMRPMEGPVQLIYRPLAKAPTDARQGSRQAAVSLNDSESPAAPIAALQSSVK